jgi:hypothetical protein
MIGMFVCLFFFPNFILSSFLALLRRHEASGRPARSRVIFKNFNLDEWSEEDSGEDKKSTGNSKVKNGFGADSDEYVKEEIANWFA